MNLMLNQPLVSSYQMVRNLWNIPSVRATWTRITSSNGGYLAGSFTIANIAASDIKDFSNRFLGYMVTERAYGTTTWEGIIYRMTITLDGVEYTRTLEPNMFHNRVNVYYSNAAIVDQEQLVLSYLAAPLRFQDTGQDFSAWETLVGDALYRIQVSNTNGTTSWAYLGASSTVLNPNDTVAVYQDEARATPGWNDADPIGPPALTAISYQVVEVLLDGQRLNTGWAEIADSEAVNGTLEYVVSLGGATAAAATALRARHLNEYGWPRSRMSGGAQFSAEVNVTGGATLTVQVAGLVATTFWTYRTATRVANIGALITGLANDCEFVTAGAITANATLSISDAFPMPQRIGDLIQELVDQGDAAGNAYQWGVYNGALLEYEAQPTTARYFIHRRRLVDASGQIVVPQLVRPGILVQSRNAPSGLVPVGGAAIDRPDTAYVTEVEFSAPSTLRLTLRGGEEIVLEQQIQAGIV